MTPAQRMAAIEHGLRQAFKVSHVEVIDDSHLHVGHTSHGGAGHFTVRLVSEDFVGVSRVKRHQMIYQALDGLMGREIHALAIEVKTPNERKDEVEGEC